MELGDNVVAGRFFSWLVLPWSISAILLPDFWGYFSSFPLSTLLPVFLFGAMWGIGNVNYGLTMRYLGMSMGIGIAIGITLIVGTLMTPILQGKFGVMIRSTGGQITLAGVFVALAGVAIVSYAGVLKERALGISTEEFNLKRVWCWLSCAAFFRRHVICHGCRGADARGGKNVGISPLYVALPSYVVIMGGGAIVNLCYCFVRLAIKPELSLKADLSLGKSLLLANALFSILGGVMWYLQFFFLRLGSRQYPV